ncbi:protoporphyrinogen oxidase [Nocardiopsis composta]
MLEAGPDLGGKLHVSEVAGVPVDAGAESVLARRPEALRLISELGLDDRVVHPAPGPARIYSRGRLRPLPEGHVMGVPGDPVALARSGVLSWAGTLRAALDLVWPRTPVRGDVPVARYIGVRMGAEVVDRLVEPMLGGVYAGRTERLSLDEALPQIAPIARGERSLMRGVRALKRRQAAAAGSGPPAPVFATLRGGLGVLIDALAERSKAEVRTLSPVTGLHPEGGGWALEVGAPGAAEPERLHADAVVLACPAPAAARLLRPVAEPAAEELAGIGYAGMAIVTLAFRAADLPARPEGSGFLVSPGADHQGRHVQQREVALARRGAARRAPRRGAGGGALLHRPGRRGAGAAPLRRGAGRRGPRRPGDGVRRAGRSPGGAADHPLGDRPPAVRHRARGARRPRPAGPGGPPLAGAVRRRLRRGGHPGLHRRGDPGGGRARGGTGGRRPAGRRAMTPRRAAGGGRAGAVCRTRRDEAARGRQGAEREHR